ncbi:MAG: hypothetical protein ACYSWO_30025 [Planctomycetota bacterium]|jgi:hypothetical protein
MKLEWVDEIIERTVRKRPGCTSRLLHIIVAKHFPLMGWPKTRQGISFITRRDKLVKKCLASGKYENRGQANKHAWYLREE